MKNYFIAYFKHKLFLNYSFDDVLVFSLDMIMTYILSTHLKLCLCNKQNFIISKVHYYFIF